MESAQRGESSCLLLVMLFWLLLVKVLCILPEQLNFKLRRRLHCQRDNTHSDEKIIIFLFVTASYCGGCVRAGGIVCRDVLVWDFCSVNIPIDVLTLKEAAEEIDNFSRGNRIVCVRERR